MTFVFRGSIKLKIKKKYKFYFNGKPVKKGKNDTIPAGGPLAEYKINNDEERLSRIYRMISGMSCDIKGFLNNQPLSNGPASPLFNIVGGSSEWAYYYHCDVCAGPGSELYKIPILLHGNSNVPDSIVEMVGSKKYYVDIGFDSNGLTSHEANKQLFPHCRYSGGLGGEQLYFQCYTDEYMQVEDRRIEEGIHNGASIFVRYRATGRKFIVPEGEYSISTNTTIASSNVQELLVFCYYQELGRITKEFEDQIKILNANHPDGPEQMSIFRGRHMNYEDVNDSDNILETLSYYPPGFNQPNPGDDYGTYIRVRPATVSAKF